MAYNDSLTPTVQFAYDTYDAENRLASTSGETYTYDGDGDRVKKVNGSTTTLNAVSFLKNISQGGSYSIPLCSHPASALTGARHGWIFRR